MNLFQESFPNGASVSVDVSDASGTKEIWVFRFFAEGSTDVSKYPCDSLGMTHALATYDQICAEEYSMMNTDA